MQEEREQNKQRDIQKVSHRQAEKKAEKDRLKEPDRFITTDFEMYIIVML